jgi:hypothetical protein
MLAAAVVMRKRSEASARQNSELTVDCVHRGARAANRPPRGPGCRWQFVVFKERERRARGVAGHNHNIARGQKRAISLRNSGGNEQQDEPADTTQSVALSATLHWGIETERSATDGEPCFNYKLGDMILPSSWHNHCEAGGSLQSTVNLVRVNQHEERK